MKKLLLFIVMAAQLLSAKVINLTGPETAFTTQQFYFPGMNLPAKGSLSLFLIYELGSGTVTDNVDATQIFSSDLQNKRIVLSYSLLDNFQMFIGRSFMNSAYDLNKNSIFVQGYDTYLNNQLQTYLTASQFNLMFPFGFKTVEHPDRDRRDNLFGFTFRIAELEKQKMKIYFDYFQEYRDYRGMFYPLKYGIAPIPQTFVDFIKEINDDYYRLLVSRSFGRSYTGYLGYENKRRRTSMHDGSYDDMHDYQTALCKIEAEWDALKLTASFRDQGVGFSASYQSGELLGIEIYFRETKSKLEDASNYFSNIFNRTINFEEQEEAVGITVTQKF